MSQNKYDKSKKESVFSNAPVWILISVILMIVCAVLAMTLINDRLSARTPEADPGVPTSGADTRPDQPVTPVDPSGETIDLSEFVVLGGELAEMTKTTKGNSTVWDGADSEGRALRFVIGASGYSLTYDGEMVDQGAFHGEAVIEDMDVLLLEGRGGKFAVPVMPSEDGTQMYFSIVDYWMITEE